MKAVINATTETFERDVIDSGRATVIDFWAPWCAPCRAVAPVLEDLAERWEGRVQVVKVNIDEEPALADAFKIRSIPTLVAMKGRNVVDVQLGAGSAAHIERLFGAAEAAVAPKEETNSETKAEVVS